MGNFWGLLAACAVLLGSVLPLRAGDSPMDQAMDRMEDAKKELFPALKQPVAADKEKYLKLAKILKEEAEKCKGLVPVIAEKLPPEEKEKLVAAYAKDLDAFILTSQSLIEALEKEQWTDAQTLAAKLREQEKSGHQAYRKKKK